MDSIDALGARKFEISPSKRTSGEGRYAHRHYAVDDLHLGVNHEYPQDGEVVVCIDTDYYLDNPDDYFGVPNPIILHTFSPRKVAGLDGDSPYTIKDNRVCYQVSGGAAWTHEVWDWCAFGEFLEFRCRIDGLKSWLLSWFGIRKVIYQKVHHARPWTDCKDRAIVWCVPCYSVWTFTWLPSDMHARRLARTRYSDPTRPGWNALVSLDDNNKLMISIGREGEDATVEMPKIDFDVLMGLQSAQSVTSRMIGMKYTDPTVMALVGQYYRKGKADAPFPDRIARPSTVRVHWPAAIEAEVPECSSRAYAGPLVSDENLMPMIKRWETLSLSLERRVEFVRNERIPQKRMHSYAEEFIRLVVPVPHVGVPYTLERTAELLDKPSQVLAVKQIWETVDMPYRRLIECFLKNEPCMKPGRIISSFADMRFLLRFSAYTLACRDQILHAEWNQHWFCPGLTPAEIANRVQEYVAAVGCPAEGDYTNLDGSVSAWLQRRVMNAVYLRYFHKSYHADLVPFLDMLISCPARAKRFGFQYDAGVGVKSGSPTTCDLNTVVGAFVQYTAVRDALPELKPEEAFRSIGLAFGDDGLFDRRFKTPWSRNAERLGLTLKVEDYEPHKGVCFLARVFPDPLNTPTSFQDPLRTWRKLHLTTRDPNISLATAAVDRVEGYLVTDALTPVTSDYCRMVLRNWGAQAESLETRQQRKSYSREQPYWLTIGGSWPQRFEDVDLMLTTMSARTGVDIEKLRTVILQLQQCNNVWAPPTINRDDEPNPYKDTLDLDCQPAEGAVDLRIVQADQHVQRGRANPGVPRESEGADGKPGDQTGRVARANPRASQQGSRQFRGISNQRGAKSAQRNNRVAGEAGSARNTQRQRQRPASRGRPIGRHVGSADLRGEVA
nr:MAG: nonstructural protein [Eriocheir sinensis nodavirus 1]